MTPKAWSVNQYIDKFDFIKIKNFCCWKLSWEWEDKPQIGSDIPLSRIWQDLYPECGKNLQNLVSEQPSSKLAEDLSRKFPKQSVWTANKYPKVNIISNYGIVN